MIKDYWIKELQDVKEFNEIGNIEDSEIQLLENEILNVINDQFIETATVRGISRRETLFGIKPYGGDTLENRRYRVGLKWNNQLPYTVRQLLNKLNTLVGEDGYVLNLINRHLDLSEFTHAQLSVYSHTQITMTATYDPSTYTVSIKINLGLARTLTETQTSIRNMIPSNMILTIDLRFNRYIDLSYYTYQSLSAKTYQQLREEALQ